MSVLFGHPYVRRCLIDVSYSIKFFIFQCYLVHKFVNEYKGDYITRYIVFAERRYAINKKSRVNAPDFCFMPLNCYFFNLIY